MALYTGSLPHCNQWQARDQGEEQTVPCLSRLSGQVPGGWCGQTFFCFRAVKGWSWILSVIIFVCCLVCLSCSKKCSSVWMWIINYKGIEVVKKAVNSAVGWECLEYRGQSRKQALRLLFLLQGHLFVFFCVCVCVCLSDIAFCYYSCVAKPLY